MWSLFIIYECYVFFYLNLRLKYVVKYLFYFFVNIRRYPWIYVDIKKSCGYLHNEYLTNMRTRYGVDIYPTDRVWGNYYPYSTRSVDILVVTNYFLSLKLIAI